MPVAAITGEPRCLDRDDCTDASFADRGQQLFEAGSRDASAGAAEIIVDDGDVIPTELPRAIGKTVLAPLAFQIVNNLIRRRLTDVDDGLASEVLRCDLAHERPPLSRVLPQPARSCRLRAPRSEGHRSGGR